MAGDDSVLNISVRDLLERGARLIVKHSTHGPNFDHRIDLYYDVDLKDPKLGRNHRVRVRLKVTATSLIFDEAAKEPAKIT